MPPQRLHAGVHREHDPRALLRLSLLFLCGFVLAAGFVHAATQQMAAVRNGYQSEELRRERARLLDEQRRLLLALDEAAAPLRLEQAAREIGLQPTQAAQVGTAAKTNVASVKRQKASSALVRPLAANSH